MEEEDDAFFTEFVTPFLMSGSDRVIKAWVSFRRRTDDLQDGAINLQDGAINIEAMLAFEDVVKAIRADLGNGGSDLEPGDLLRTYFNDLDHHLPRQKSP